ncbi:MAG TPA: SRPBCC family protein [Actinomycetota bacterium]|nr:SRPBCC family protein [Actinomycetota bacterium]
MAPPVIIEMSVEINGPAQVVWDRLVDWENLGQWMKEAWDFRVTTRHREGVGVEAEAKVRVAGITTADSVIVRRWEPPEWFEIEHMGWVGGRGLMHCRPTANGTYLWWRETLQPPLGWLGWVGMQVVRPVMAWIFNRDLALLKELVEAQPR